MNKDDYIELQFFSRMSGLVSLYTTALSGLMVFFSPELGTAFTSASMCAIGLTTAYGAFRMHRKARKGLAQLGSEDE